MLPLSEAAEDFVLLTFHGTLLVYARAQRVLCHRPVDEAAAGFLPVRLLRAATGELSALLPAPPASDAADHEGLRAAFASIAFEDGLLPGTVALRRREMYASAERNGAISVAAIQCMGWESFLRVAPAGLALLRHISESSWLVGGAPVEPSAIRMAARFTLNFGALEVDLAQRFPQVEDGNRNRFTLSPRGGGTVVAARVRAPRAAPVAPKIWILPLGNTANRALQYMTAEAMRVEYPEAVIENIQLAEWGRHAPVPRPAPARAAVTGHDRYRIDVPGLADCLRRGVVETVVLDSYTYNLDQFPPRAVAKGLLGETATGREARGFGPRELVCVVRADEILRGVHPDYLVLPPGYYRKLQERTGLDLVFYGQLGDDIYSQSLRDAFPRARFIPGRDPGYDFDVLRRSVHLALAISTFAWLAAWLSEAETIFLPVGGMFNPVQHPDLMFFPFDAPEVQYVLLPYQKMFELQTDPARFMRQQEVLGAQARFADAAEVREIWLRAEPLGRGRVLVGGFDPEFYTETYPDVLRWMENGQPALAHFLLRGAAEGRQALNFDADFYVERYPDAAMEIAAGLQPTPLKHFMAVGWRRGYAPTASAM